jgi:predicted transcriptional regulator
LYVASAVIGFRASPVLQRRLDELAEAHGGSRATAIRSAVVEATLPEHASRVPDRDEVLELLGEAARGGSVAAMVELLRGGGP